MPPRQPGVLLVAVAVVLAAAAVVPRVGAQAPLDECTVGDASLAELQANGTAPAVITADRLAAVRATLDRAQARLADARSRVVYERDYVNGQLGAFQVLKLRWGMGDPESYIWDSSQACQISVGTYKGADDVLRPTALPRATHIYDVPDPLRQLSPVWTDAAGPGVYDCFYAFGYYECLVKYDARAWTGYTLYATLRCENGALSQGRTVTLRGVTVDQSPPTLQRALVRPGLRQDNEVNWMFQNDPTAFNVSWTNAWNDMESAVRDVTAVLGTAPGRDDVGPAQTFTLAQRTWAAWLGLNVSHNVTLFATVTARNVARPAGTTTFTPRGVLVDLAPPAVWGVGDGTPDMPGRAYRYAHTIPTGGLQDIDFSSYVDASFAAWAGGDWESGIDRYEWAVVRPWTGAADPDATPDGLAAASALGLGGNASLVSDPWVVFYGTAGYNLLPYDLEHGARYVNALRAVDRAGNTGPVLWSDGFVCDLTPPLVGAPAPAGNYSDMAYAASGGFDARWNWVNASVPVISSQDPFLRFAWAAGDPESDVAECWVEVGSFQGGSDVQRPLSTLRTRSWNGSVAALGLQSGGAYYGTVTCINYAGLPTTNFSAPVAVDVLPPVIAPVLDLYNLESQVDVLYTDKDAYAAAAWPFVRDAHGGLRTCWAALGRGTNSDANRTSVVPWTETGTQPFLELFDLALPTNVRLFWSVKCVDVFNNEDVQSSDGFIVDRTPPACAREPCVADGSFAALADPVTGATNLFAPDDDFWTYRNEFVCRWPNLGDPESALWDSRVSLAYTPSMRGPFIAGPLQTRGVPYAFFQGLDLAQNSTLYCVVSVTNGVNMTASWVSNGVFVDYTPPSCAAKVVAPGDLTTMVVVEVNVTETVWVWANATAASNATNATAGTRSPTTSATTTATASGTRAATRSGSPSPSPSPAPLGYWVNVTRLVNVTRATRTAWDALAPMAYGSAYGGVALAFSCDDPESGISEVSVALGYAAGDAAVMPPVALPPGSASGGAYANVTLPWEALTRFAPFANGRSLVFSIYARNGASVRSLVPSAGVVLDTTPPAPIESWPAGWAPVVMGPDAATGAIPLALSANATHVVASAFLVDPESPMTALQMGVSVVRGFPAGVADPLAANNTPAGNLTALAPRTLGWVNVSMDTGTMVTATFALPAGVTANLTRGDLLTAFALVRSVNAAGLEARYRSAGMLIDASPPVCAPLSNASGVGPLFVLDGLPPPDAPPSRNNRTGDDDFQLTVGSVGGRWNCSDPGSGMAGYELTAEPWNFATALWEPGAPVCTGPTALAASQLAGSTQGCDIVQGGRYRLRVDAINGAGLRTTVYSNGVRVDTTPPVVTGPIDVLPPLRNNTFHVHRGFLAFTLPPVVDAESGVVAAEYAIGSDAARAPADFLPWANVTSALPPAAPGTPRVVNITAWPNGTRLDLPSGGRFVVSLRARNPLGLVATATSQTLLVDYSAPTRGTAELGAFTLPPGFQDQAGFGSGVVTGATVAVQFKGWADPESSLASLRVALYMLSSPAAAPPATSAAVGADRVVTDAATVRDRCRGAAATATLLAGWTPVDTVGKYSVAFPGVTLCNRSLLVAVVSAVNNVDIETFGAGARAQVNISRLSPGIVADGTVPGVDLDVSPAGNGLWAQWAGFSDSQGLVITYEVGWSVRPNGTELSGGWRRAKFATNFSLVDAAPTGERVRIADGTFVYATVRATNAAGAQVASTSDGVLYDASPPVGPAAGLGWMPGAQTPALTPGAPVYVNWACSDPHSGVLWVEVSLGASPTAPDSLLRPVRLSGAAAAKGVYLTNVTLPQGGAAFASVTCTNGVGLRSVGRSEGGYADATPPLVRQATPDGPTVISSLWPPARRASGSTPWFLTNATGFFVGWDVLDPESGTAGTVLCVGTSPNATDVLPCTPVGGAISVYVALGGGNCSALAPGLSPAATGSNRGVACVSSGAPPALLAHGATVYARVAVTNGANMTASLVASAVVDTAPLANLTAAVVYAHREAGTGRVVAVDARPSAAFLPRQLALDVLVAQPSAVAAGPDGALVAPVAPLATLLMAVNCTRLVNATTGEVARVAAVPLTTFNASTLPLAPGVPAGRIAGLVVAPNVSLPDMAGCTLTVWPQSASGLTAPPLTVAFQTDAAPPALDYVSIGRTPEDARAVESAVWPFTDRVSVIWSASDEGTGVASTELCLADGDADADAGCVVPWTPLPPNASYTGRNVTGARFTFTGLALAVGKRYVARMRVSDRAGLAAVRSSVGVLVDSRPPAPGRLLQPATGYLAHANDITVSFSPFASASTPITKYEVAIARSADVAFSAPLLAWTAVPSSLLAASARVVSGAPLQVLTFRLSTLPPFDTGANATGDGGDAAEPAESPALTALAASIRAAVNVTLAVRATNGAGLTSVARSGALLSDESGPALDANFTANPVRYAAAAGGVAGTAATLQRGVFFYRTLSHAERVPRVVPQSELAAVGEDGEVALSEDAVTSPSPSAAANASAPTAGGAARTATLGSKDVTGVGVGWTGLVDPQSGIADAAMLWLQACTPPAAADGGAAEPECALVLSAEPVSFSAGFFFAQGFLIEPGTTFTASLVITNGAGAALNVTTPKPLVIDVVPPAGSVFDGFPAGADRPPGWPAAPAGLSGDDADYWMASDSVAASWNFTDAGGLSSFRWAVCVATATAVTPRASAECPLPWTPAGSNTSARLPLGPRRRLRDGVAYRTWVMAFDTAGNSAVVASDGFVVDTTPPDARGRVVQAPPFVGSWRELGVALFNVTDSESAILQVQAQATLQSGGGGGAGRGGPTVLVPMRPISLTLSATPPTLASYLNESAAAAAGGSGAPAAAPLITLDFVVFNRAGLSTRFTASTPVRVDPFPANVTEVLPVPGPRWGALNFSAAPASDGGGLARAALLPAAVATRNTSNLGFWWAVQAGASGVAHVHTALGTACGADDVVPFRKAPGWARAAAFSGLRLRSGGAYVLTLRLESGAGVVSQACSAPVTVDLEAPTGGVAVDDRVEPDFTPASPAGATVYQPVSAVAARVTGFADVVSGVARYEARVCEADGVVCASEWADLRGATRFSWAGDLRPGVTYRVGFRAYDGAGNYRDVWSPGQVFDPSPPAPPAKVAVVQPIIAGWADLELDFEEWADGQSGVHHYELGVALRRRNGTLVTLLPPTDFGAETSYRAGGAILGRLHAAWANGEGNDDGTRPADLFITVTGVNRAGWNSTLQAYARLDDTPPTAGRVVFQSVDVVPSKTLTVRSLAANASDAGLVEALSATVDYDHPPRFQVSRRSLAFVFTGFHDPEQDSYSRSPLTYLYAVGTAPGGEDVRRWTRFYLPPAVELGPANASEFSLDYGTLVTNDATLAHTVTLTSLDLPNGVTLFATVMAVNEALLNVSVSSGPLTIDATTPLSTHAAPLIDLQPALDDAANATAAPANGTAPRAGYGGVGTASAEYDAAPLDAWGDADWSGSGSYLAFAFRGWADPESALDHVEYAMVELGEAEGYSPETRDPDDGARPGDLPATASASYLRYLSATADDALAVALPSGRRLELAQTGAAVAAARRRALQDAAATAAGGDNATAAAAANVTEDVSSWLFNETRVDDAGVVGMVNVRPRNASRALPDAEEVAATMEAAALPPTFAGALTSPFAYFGGRALTQFLPVHDSGGSANITVGGLRLEPGHVYGVALRAYSGSNQITQLVSDGVRVDTRRAAPCFGAIAVGPLARRPDSQTLLDVVAGRATGLPRPDAPGGAGAPPPGASQASQFGTSPSSDPYDVPTFVPSTSTLELSFMHFADPYVQRPSALQRLHLCPSVDGYGGDLNAAYVGDGEEAPAAAAPAPFQLSMSGIATYAVRLEAASVPTANATAEVPVNPGTDGASRRLTSARARLLAAADGGDGAAAPPTTGDVPLHATGAAFTDGSGACCREGFDRHDPLIPSVATDVELRPTADEAVGFGRSLAVVGPAGAGATGLMARTYAVVGSVGAAQVVPLHHARGAYRHVDMASLTGSPGAVTVAASKVPSGFAPGARLLTSPEEAPGAPPPLDERAPAFAVANDAAVLVMEVHPDPAAAGQHSAVCTPPQCAPDTGFAFEDMAAVAESEAVYVVASVVRNASVFDPDGAFGGAVALRNRTLAVGGTASAAVRAGVAARQPLEAPLPPGAGAVQVCEDVFKPTLELERDPTAPPPHRFAWEAPVCGVVSPPPGTVAPLSGVDALPVPFMVAPEAAAFGAGAVALAPRALAVGAVAATRVAVADGGIVTTDAVALFTSTLPSGALDEGDVYSPEGSPLLRGVLAAPAQPAALEEATLVDPLLVAALMDAAGSTSPSDAFVANTGFGAALDFSADGRVLLVGAPGGRDGRGVVYAYVLPADGGAGAPQLACAAFGGLARFTRLGESVGALDVDAYALPPGVDDDGRTLALGVASLHAVGPLGPNGTVTEAAGALVFAVRAPAGAGAWGAYQPSTTTGNATALGELGVPACPVVALVGGGGRLDLRTQLGLRARNATAADAAQAFLDARLAAAPEGAAPPLAVAPVVAGGGAHLLVADAAARTWEQGLADVAALNATRGAAPGANLTAFVRPSAATGKLWAAAFCPRNAARRKSEPQFAVLPFTCRACGAGEASFGGPASMCTSCPPAAACAGRVDASGAPVDTLVSVRDDGLALAQGGVYRVYVRGVTASGRWVERPGPLIMVDATPPTDAEVRDAPYSGDDGKNGDLHATADMAHGHVWFSGFADPESGIERFLVGMSSTPCDGLLRRRCVVKRLLLNAAEGVYMDFSENCSPLELAWRDAAAGAMGVAVDALGTPAAPLPFDLDDPAAWDVAPLTDIGLNITHSWTFPANVTTGTYAFACAVAVNRAGLRRAVSSDGVVYDDTPPVVVRGSVKDGLMGSPDYDQQNIPDGLLANWVSTDPESGVLFHAWAYTTDPHPVLDAYLVIDNDGGAPDWGDVQAALNTTFVHWETLPAVRQMRVDGLELPKGPVFYAAVRAQNAAGLWSNVEVSDGVAYGKAEIKPEPGKPAAVGFNSKPAAANYTSDAEQRAAQGGVVGSMALPAGALGDDDGSGAPGGGNASQPRAGSIVAGALDDADVAGAGDIPGVVNSSAVPPPARNFAFGGYSFAIKAKDDAGAIIPGYRFAKPILVSLAYTVPPGLSDAEGARYAPQLNLYDIETGAWKPGVDSCTGADRWENIDYDNRIYSVHICHLTQFSLFYQQQPVALVKPPAATALVDSVGSLAPLPNASDYAPSTGYESLPPLLYSQARGAPMPVLDASDSYDPDGFVASVRWALVGGPPVDALAAARDAGALTPAEFAADLAALSDDVLLPFGPLGARAQVVFPPANASGVWRFQVTVLDENGANASTVVTVVVNAAPTIVFSRDFYAPPALGGEPFPVRAGAEASAAFNATAASAGPGDVVLDASLSVDGDARPGTAGIVSWAWELDLNASSWPAGAAPATLEGADANAPVVLLRGASGGSWAVRLTVADALGGSASATAYAGRGLSAAITNGSYVAVATPDFVLDASATVSQFDAGALVFVWRREVTDPATGITLAEALPVVGGPAVRVTNVTALGTYTYGVMVVDPLGIASTARVAVRRHAPPVAVAVGVTPNASVPWCGPSFQVRLNATGSFDPDGAGPVGVRWSYVYTPADVPATSANDVFAPAGASPLFAVDGGGAVAAASASPAPGAEPGGEGAANATAAAEGDAAGAAAASFLAVVVRNRLSMGRYAFSAVVTDADGAVSVSPPVEVLVGADGYVAVGSPFPAATTRPPYACTAPPTPSVSRTGTPSSTRTPSGTRSNSPTRTNTRSGSPTVTTSATATASGSMTPTMTATSSGTPSVTGSETATRSGSRTGSATPTLTPSRTGTASTTPSGTPTPTRSPVTPSATPTGSTTPLPGVGLPLAAGSALALRVGPIFTAAYAAGWVDEFTPSAAQPGAAVLRQTLRLPALGSGAPVACAFAPAAGPASGHGGLVFDPADGGSWRVVCAAGPGGAPAVARVWRNGTVTVHALPDGADGGVAVPVDADGPPGSVLVPPPATGALPPLAVAATGAAGVSLASVRAAAALPSGELIFTNASGVFLAPAVSAAGAGGGAVRLTGAPGAFDGPDTLQPALLHVDAGTRAVFVSGRPPRGWAPPGSPCAPPPAGSAAPALFRFAPSSAGWECTGRFPRLGRAFFNSGHAMGGAAGPGAGEVTLFVATDGYLARCVLPPPGVDAPVACTEFATVGEVAGAAHAFRGVAGVA